MPRPQGGQGGADQETSGGLSKISKEKTKVPSNWESIAPRTSLLDQLSLGIFSAPSWALDAEWLGQ